MARPFIRWGEATDCEDDGTYEGLYIRLGWGRFAIELHLVRREKANG